MSTERVSTITIPIEIKLDVTNTGTVSVAGAQESVMAAVARFEEARKKYPGVDFEVESQFELEFNKNYGNRKGYNADFLGDGFKVHLPKLEEYLVPLTARLLANDNEYVLKYHNYSVVMHKARKLAIYSAANVKFSERYEMSRPKDVWRLDPRIPASAQLGEFYYARNNFDRGHLTRREDLEFGPKRVDALDSAADTFHFTNCAPQHSRFNQSKAIWQGIERHILEESIKSEKFNAQIITGTVLDEGDPLYKGLQYPLRYWKIAAAINAKDDLFATAYIASQEDVIDEFGIEAAPEIPFAPFKMFQVKISEIERLTGLSFTYSKKGGDIKPLSDKDPLNKRLPRTNRRRVNFGESSAQAAFVPEGYILLETADDIVH
jgi:endonuclease G